MTCHLILGRLPGVMGNGTPYLPFAGRGAPPSGRGVLPCPHPKRSLPEPRRIAPISQVNLPPEFTNRLSLPSYP